MRSRSSSNDKPERDATASNRATTLSVRQRARRRFLLETSVLTGGIAAARYARGADAPSGSPPPPASAATDARAAMDARPVRLVVNGQPQTLNIEPRVTLLDALREYLGYTGTKKGCDRGQCGACTVMVNDRRVNSCLTLAMSCEGDRITTIEGLGSASAMHPLQRAFVKHDGFQCGYCTPGQICSAAAMLTEFRAGAASAVTANLAPGAAIELTDDELRERMSGNLCRCGAYAGIVAAVREAAEETG
jgi:xanthine dehydrogenase YagT iron-sulfur-binding subunit